MCTAYRLGKRNGNFTKQLNQTANQQLDAINDTRLLRPTLDAPVILPSGEITNMRWGFSRDFSKAIVNSREDKLESPMWNEAMNERRCLIPVAAYFEWSGPPGNKRTHHFFSPEANWLLIAGIWEKHPELGRCFSMVTTQPTGVVIGIHDRMPAVLSKNETDDFLNGELRTFQPACDLLLVEDSPNPLQKGKLIQGELF